MRGKLLFFSDLYPCTMRECPRECKRGPRTRRRRHCVSSERDVSVTTSTLTIYAKEYFYAQLKGGITSSYPSYTLSFSQSHFFFPTTVGILHRFPARLWGDRSSVVVGGRRRQSETVSNFILDSLVALHDRARRRSILGL